MPGMMSWRGSDMASRSKNVYASGYLLRVEFFLELDSAMEPVETVRLLLAHDWWSESGTEFRFRNVRRFKFDPRGLGSPLRFFVHNYEQDIDFSFYCETFDSAAEQVKLLTDEACPRLPAYDIIVSYEDNGRTARRSPQTGQEPSRGKRDLAAPVFYRRYRAAAHS